jgi:hypothetical protein
MTSVSLSLEKARGNLEELVSAPGAQIKLVLVRTSFFSEGILFQESIEFGMVFKGPRLEFFGIWMRVTLGSRIFLVSQTSK